MCVPSSIKLKQRCAQFYSRPARSFDHLVAKVLFRLLLFYSYFYYLLKFGYLVARRSQPLAEPGADEARRADDALAWRLDAARPGVALAAGSAGRDRPAGRRPMEQAAKPPRKFSIVPSRRARARGCAIVLFAVCARFIGAEGVIKLCDMLLKFDTRRYAALCYSCMQTCKYMHAEPTQSRM